MGERIRRAREESRLTQDELAARVGTTRQVVIGWEKGRHDPRPASRAKIVVATGVLDLFEDDDEEPG